MEKLIKLFGILVLLVFYTIYLGKMYLQSKKGIKTDQIAKRKVKDKIFYTELILKIATYLIIIVEVISIIFTKKFLPPTITVLGAILCILGDIIFASAVFTMKDSWRAGLAENDKTEMITEGIYKYSRNPAFLGFDCVYIGILLIFFNWILLLCTLFAMTMLHIQILQEEKYLPTVFGDKYLEYKSTVNRYFGRII